MPITKHNFLVTEGRGHPAHDRGGLPHRLDRPPGPGPGRHRQGRAAGADHVLVAAGDRPARLPAGHQAAREADPRGRQADRGGQAPGPVRRRRRPEGRRDRRAEGPRGAHRGAGHHHPDGARRVPRQPPAARGNARHARCGHRRHRAAEVGPAHRARHPLRRPRHRQAGQLRAVRQGHPRGHRPRRDRQEPRGRRPDRGRRPRGRRRPGPGRPGRVLRGPQGRLQRPGGRTSTAGARPTRSATTSRTTARCPRSA